MTSLNVDVLQQFHQIKNLVNITRYTVRRYHILMVNSHSYYIFQVQWLTEIFYIENAHKV